MEQAEIKSSILFNIYLVLKLMKEGKKLRIYLLNEPCSLKDSNSETVEQVFKELDKLAPYITDKGYKLSDKLIELLDAPFITLKSESFIDKEYNVSLRYLLMYFENKHIRVLFTTVIE